MARHFATRANENCGRRPTSVDCLCDLTLSLYDRLVREDSKLTCIRFQAAASEKDEVHPVAQFRIPALDLRKQRSTRLACRADKKEDRGPTVRKDAIQSRATATDRRKIEIWKRSADRKTVVRTACTAPLKGHTLT